MSLQFCYSFLLLVSIIKSQAWGSKEHELVSYIENCLDPSCDRVELTIHTVARTFLLDLKRAENLISDNYFEQVGSEEPVVIVQGRSSAGFDCVYQSSNPRVLASVTLCGRGVEGFFTTQDGSFTLHFDEELKQTHLFESEKQDVPPVTLEQIQVMEEVYAKWLPNLPDRSPQEISSRSLKDLELFLEYLVIIDQEGYKNIFKSNLEEAKDFTKVFASNINQMYQKDNTVNLKVVLIGLIVWTDGDPILFDRTGRCKDKPCEQGQRLDDLINYNVKHLFPKYNHDSAVVFTGKVFQDKSHVLGISNRGVTCNAPELAIHSVRLWDRGESQLTAIHELGHNLGFEDNAFSEREFGLCGADYAKKCYGGCNDDFCIMSACHQVGAVLWDECSRKIFKMRLEAGKYWCLLNRPITSMQEKTKFLGACGNGILEYGEQCDCFFGDDKCKRCCNVGVEFTEGTACKLKTNAKCSIGPCCDVSTCLFKTGNTSCSTSGSDEDCGGSESKCTGDSGFCPDDVKGNDGKKCKNDENMVCYKGSCISKCPQNCYGQGDCVGNVKDGFRCDCYSMYYGALCQIRQDVATHIAFGVVLGFCAFFITLIVFRLLELRRAGWKYQKLREE